jgi:hypothetical protein
MRADFPISPEDFAATIASIALHQGRPEQTALATYSTPHLALEHSDDWDGGTDYYAFHLMVPPKIYVQLEDELHSLEQEIQKAADVIMKPYRGFAVRVGLCPATVVDANWRAKADAWLNGRAMAEQETHPLPDGETLDVSWKAD